MSSDVNQVLFEGQFLRLVRQGRWEFAQRVHSARAVIIVALTDDCRVVLVEQYRVPLSRRVIEFPAGMVGDEPLCREEPLIVAARRELLEETGYQAGVLREVFCGACSAGLTDEQVTFFLASGLQKVASGGGVHGEDIQIHEIPLASCDVWLEQQRTNGMLLDARLLTGLYLLKQRS